jgi:hypothetical protein
MAINFDDFVEQVREANPIEEVLEESGMKLRGHGRLRTGTKHDSVKVRTDMGRVWWYSQNWSGDVFGWIMREKGVEFSEALETLAKRAHIEMPKFQNVNESEVQRRRATADVFSVAANVFHRWLMGDEEHGIQADTDALAYVRGRGWTDETTHAALTGFSGRRQEWQVKDMLGEFSLYGINPQSLAAVAVLGFEGDVDKWAKDQGVREHEDFDEAWIGWGRIFGLIDKPGVIYAHQHRGGVRYLSRRNLPGFDTRKDSKTGKVRDDKSFNPFKLMAGPKQPYFNHVHRVDRPIVGVEGQGDAKTWGQWGQGAVAFCGLLGNLETMGEDSLAQVRQLAAYLKKHPALYLNLDEDEEGQKAIKTAVRLLGPKVQIVRIPRLVGRNEANEVEDESPSTASPTDGGSAQDIEVNEENNVEG